MTQPRKLSSRTVLAVGAALVAASACGTDGTDVSRPRANGSTGGSANGGADAPSGGRPSSGGGSPGSAGSIGGSVSTGGVTSAGRGGLGGDGGLGGASGGIGGLGGARGWRDPITGSWSEELPFGYVTAHGNWYVSFDDADKATGQLSAGFWETHPDPCSFEVVGDHCVFQRCTATTFPNEANAGIIDLDVDGEEKLSLSYNGTAWRYQQVLGNHESPWTEGGQAVVLSASGRTAPFPEGEVPAFSVDLVSPDRVTITSPALDAQIDESPQPQSVTRSEGLTVSWTGTSPGSLVASLGHQVPGDRHYATCRFDPAPGSGTLPAELLEKMPTGSGSIYLRTASERIVEVGDWRLLVQARTNAVLPSGKNFYSGITLE